MDKARKLFSGIYYNHRADVYKNALRITGIESEAEEIVQDVFLRLWEQRERLQEIEDISSFLFILSRNKGFDLLRKTRRERQKIEWMKRDFETTTRHYFLEDWLLEKQMRQAFKEAVVTLPIRQKQVFSLQVNGWKSRQIAIELGISGETVKTHLEKASRSVSKYILFKCGGTK